jgi:dTDP-4-amino-4,6-dideoxygalactose transaminase
MLKQDYGVDPVVGNPPVYQTDAYDRRMIIGQSCPIAEELGARLFCPPMYPLMSDSDNECICAAIVEAVERLRS